MHGQTLDSSAAGDRTGPGHLERARRRDRDDRRGGGGREELISFEPGR